MGGDDDESKDGPGSYRVGGVPTERTRPVDPDRVEVKHPDTEPPTMISFTGSGRYLPVGDKKIGQAITPDIVDLRGLIETGVPDAVRTQLTAPPPVPTDAETKAIILVEELARASPSLAGRFVKDLVALGPEVVCTVARRFPGSLWFDRHAPHTRAPRGGDVSGVASALVAFGVHAVPWIAALLEADHEDIRYYAVLVAGEIRHPDLLLPCGRLAFDDDDAIRGEAMNLLAQMGDGPGRPELRATLLGAAENRNIWPDFRVYAVEGLAALADRSCVEMIRKLLDDPTPAVAAACQIALEKIDT